MIGIFDSGAGGLAASAEVRRLFEREDIIFLADRENAPYGTKTEDELLPLVKNDIRRLCELGAEKILIACCTASTVYRLLTEDEQSICLPIIPPTVEAVGNSTHTAVIATERTVNSHAFSELLRHLYPKIKVSEIMAQELVSLVEYGRRTQSLAAVCRSEADELSEKIKKTGADTLILGCTHFAHLEAEFRIRLPDIKIINSAREGAIALKNSLLPRDKGRATVRYI